MGLECWKWRPYKVRSLVSNSMYAKKDRNGPPSANQVASKHQPRHGHAVSTLRVHPPTSPCPALSAHAEPKSQGHCRMWHHEAESLMMDKSAIGPKETLNKNWTMRPLFSQASMLLHNCVTNMSSTLILFRLASGGSLMWRDMLQTIHYMYISSSNSVFK